MAEDRSPELLQGTLDMLILKTLETGPNHGYGVARRIRQLTDEVLQVEEGSLYPALHRLEKRRYVTSQWRRSDANRRARYYRLTGRGRSRLSEQVAAWNVVAGAIGRVLGASRAAPAPGAPP